MREIKSNEIRMKSNLGFVFTDKQDNFDALIKPGDKVFCMSKDGKTKITMICFGSTLLMNEKKTDVVPVATVRLDKIKEERVRVEQD